MADADGVSAAWRALGRQLAASRRAGGLTQQQLAGLADYSRTTVANAETGRQHVPRGFWERCDEALGTGNTLARGRDEVIALARRGQMQEATAARWDRARSHSPARAAAAAPVGEVGPDPPGGLGSLGQLESLRQRMDAVLRDGAVSGAGLDSLDEAVSHHGRVARYRPPAELIIDLGADMAEVEVAIRQCRSAASLRRLARVAAQLSGLMCLVFVRLDQRTAFWRWADTARTAAEQAQDQAALSWVLAQEAYGHYYCGDISRAVEVARRAQGLMRHSPGAGGALAAALEARAHSARGDARQTQATLGRAEAILASLGAGSVTASAFGYTESQLRFHEGSAYTRLGDTRLAFRAQERALELCPPGDYTDWALTQFDRASCLRHDGDLAAAVEHATRTLTTLTAGQRQGIIALRARGLVDALPGKYWTVPAVRDLSELLAPAPGEKGMPGQ